MLFWFCLRMWHNSAYFTRKISFHFVSWSMIMIIPCELVTLWWNKVQHRVRTINAFRKFLCGIYNGIQFLWPQMWWESTGGLFITIWWGLEVVFLTYFSGRINIIDNLCNCYKSLDVLMYFRAVQIRLLVIILSLMPKKKRLPQVYSFPLNLFSKVCVFSLSN